MCARDMGGGSRAMYILGRLNRSILDHKGGSRPRRRLGRLKGTQRETLLKESHAATGILDDFEMDLIAVKKSSNEK